MRAVFIIYMYIATTVEACGVPRANILSKYLDRLGGRVV